MPTKAKTHKPARVKDDRERIQANARQRKRTFHTGSAPWQAIRRRVLAGEPLCRTCKANGLLTVATVVDHWDEDPTNNRDDNLVPTCASCHNRKTRAAQGEKIASNRAATARRPNSARATAHKVVKK